MTNGLAPARRAQADLVSLAGDLQADSAAKLGHPLVNDAVVNLHAITAFSQHTGPVQGVEVLRHIGLGGRDLAE